MAPSDPSACARLRYSTVAIVLHWAIALLIVYNLTSGLLHDVLPGAVFRFHVLAGITILVLSVARLLWRLTHRPPPLLAARAWERRTAHGVHALLYAAILILPFSGWALVSAKPPMGSAGAAWNAEHPVGEASRAKHPRGPTMVWGMVPLPLLSPIAAIGRTSQGVPAQRALRARIATFHQLGGWVMLALLLLHVAGAFKHQWVDRQRALARMGIGR
ncbi:cytochrome b [Sphingomonas sp. AAP5]|uniref:cytochrome b n=1 Tax=Sphingomonas sp. AAP5 TaxID=1523415 RepID=UPI001405138F|nr:cytochrome b/b6 domain-containing protein [Sphingomonas sp. AAP5]